MSTPIDINAKLTSGDTWSWTQSLADYPATSWTLTFYFENGSAKFTAQATANGDDHLITVPAAATADLEAGRYHWIARVTDGSRVYSIADGWTTVLPNPASLANQDRRSWARRALDAVEATIEGRASSDQLSFQIKDRAVSRIPVAELWQLRQDLKAEVRTEERGAKAGLGRYIKTRFGRG